jgi:Cu+-exporting ATPase
VVHGRTLALVSSRHVKELKLVMPPTLADQSTALQQDGRTVSWLIDVDQPAILGLLAFGDSLKATAQAAIARLHRLDVKTALISGDNRGSAEAVAKLLGIDEVHAEVPPADWRASYRAESQRPAGGDGRDGSMMRRHWPQPILALPCRPVPMSPCMPPASP